jgi:protein-tyrosine phosphatase
MIDIHCHILSGIDDGAKTSRDTLTMLKSAIDEGIQLLLPRHIIILNLIMNLH